MAVVVNVLDLELVARRLVVTTGTTLGHPEQTVKVTPRPTLVAKRIDDEDELRDGEVVEHDWPFVCSVFLTRPNLSDLSDPVNPKPPLNGNELITTAGQTPKGHSTSSSPISALISQRIEYQT